MSEQSHVRRLKRQGKKLAKANKACKGTPNNKGQFYRCVSRKLEKIFKGKKK